ncbi:DNA-damage-repair/toleration protein 111 [Silene latifolia]|uniref:DNA-damage-repair/toleration protein 111 n=1 Tax=Silene latifolia TaxID=37657 RepID=UPI003D77B564
MLGGLYGDLPPPSSTADDEQTTTTTGSSGASIWSSSVKMAPPTLRKPTAATTTYTPPPSILRKPKTLISTPDNHHHLPPPPPPSSTAPALVGVTSSVVEEYDPARPNSYEDYRREKKIKARDAEIRRELERRHLEDQERDKDKDKVVRNVAVSGEEAWQRRAAMSGGGPPMGEGEGDGFSIGKSETVGLGVGAGGQMTAAQRMMAKMGWKEGQGLGRQEQGITTPLMAKKTDRRAGVIVNASEKKQQQQQSLQEQEKKAVKSVSFNGPPTRVLLLRNMVGPGEVDDELEDEVASECAKYGTVTRVLIFEITEPDFPSIEAVRIFIQFERPEETTKAYIDLDGRFFGGRVVRAAFYDEDRFNKNELAPLPGEVPGF